MLAARLGVDAEESGESWKNLLKLLEGEGCRYVGIMSNSFEKWWMEKVKKWWQKMIPEMPNFKYEEAAARVELLNKKTGLALVKAEPIEEEMSQEYWTLCVATRKPLDPSDGFVCNRRFRREWEENEYISLKGALSEPKFMVFLSKTDRRDIIAYGEEIGKK